MIFGKFMSKIGEKEIIIPTNVQLELKDTAVMVKGTLGEMIIDLPRGIKVEKNEDKLRVLRARDDKRTKALHGLIRSLIANAVYGVEKPWEKKLEVVGTGYSASLQGENLVFKVGYSHTVTMNKVAGINFKLEGNNKITVLGYNKELVGQIAHKIKMIRKPDAYKGKGIKYEGEFLRIKPGKKAKAAGAA